MLASEDKQIGIVIKTFPAIIQKKVQLCRLCPMSLVVEAHATSWNLKSVCQTETPSRDRSLFGVIIRIVRVHACVQLT